MGKAKRWLRSLLGAKKSSPAPIASGSRGQQRTHGPSTGGIPSRSPYHESLDANKHAIAVAAATAAVAEAALAAAHAAAEVVRLTGGGSRAHYGGARWRAVAAVKIQSAFRAYLARRALRALKGLVKLQALVRGHIVRKHSADMLRRMQAMARVQARASATRCCLSTTTSSHCHHHPVSKNPSTAFIKFNLTKCSSKSNANGSSGQQRQQENWLEIWMEETSQSAKHARPDNEKSDKILEVDTWKPHLREILPLGSMIIREAESAACTVGNTPRVHSASSSRPGSSHKRSPFTSRGEYSQSVFGDHPSRPNYMANTESSRAKLRSCSAPKQRTQFQKSGSTQRLWDRSDTNSERGF